MDKATISKKWAEIIRDMEGDDIVLEIKVLNPDLERQNALLKFFGSGKYSVKYFFAGQEMDLPSTIGLETFLSDYTKELVIDFQTCTLHYHFIAVDEMEFYTGSVLHLNSCISWEASCIQTFIYT